MRVPPEKSSSGYGFISGVVLGSSLGVARSDIVLFLNASIKIADVTKERHRKTTPPRKLLVRWLIAPIA